MITGQKLDTILHFDNIFFTEEEARNINCPRFYLIKLLFGIFNYEILFS